MARKTRRLNDDDFEGMWEAATDRVTDAFRKPRKMTREEIIAFVKQSNSYRWWRLQHDYKWLKRQMKKLGQNPDDARELL